MEVPPNRLTELRQQRGLTMQQIADHLKVTRETVRRWERLETAIPDYRKIQLAALLGVTLGEFVGWNGEQ